VCYAWGHTSNLHTKPHPQRTSIDHTKPPIYTAVMHENQEHPELEHISLDAKTRIAQIIESSFQSALAKVAESESLLEFPADVSPAFNIDGFSKSSEYDAIDPNEALRKTYQPHEFGYFIVNAGNVRLELKGSLDDIQDGNFTCSQIWVNGKSLYISISKYDDDITITQHTKAGEDLFKAFFNAFFNDEKEGEARFLVEDRDTFLSDAYEQLPELIERNIDTEEAEMSAGRLMNVAEGVRYMRILEEVYDSGMPLERGVSRLEYPVMSDPEYANPYNPDGLYIAFTVHSPVGILDSREVPIPLLDNTGEVVGWTVAHLTYGYSSEDPSDLKQEWIKFKNGADFVMEYENDLGPLREQYANEKNAVDTTTAFLEDFFDGYQPSFSTVEEAFSQLDDELSLEALNEISQTIEFSQTNRAFGMLSESILNEFSAAFPEMDNKPYLPDFLSSYLAYKIYTGQLEEDDARERIRTRTSFTGLGNLNSFIKYLVSERGTRRLLLQ